MAAKAGLPMGIEDFQEMRTSGYYYIDKTGMIRDLLENMGKVTLFTRPRHFGKTLNMSMLKYFSKWEVSAKYLTDWKSLHIRNSATGIWEDFRFYPSA